MSDLPCYRSMALCPKREAGMLAWSSTSQARQLKVWHTVYRQQQEESLNYANSGASKSYTLPFENLTTQMGEQLNRNDYQFNRLGEG